MAKVYSFLVFSLLLVFAPSLASAATLSINPPTGSFETGQRISVEVIAVSNNITFNAVSGTVYFPTSLFSIESISKRSSVLDFWVTEPLISKASGTVKFEGVALGGTGKSTGNIITVNLRAIHEGTDKVSFQSGQILANDGEGTDITGSLLGALYSVKEAVARPAPAPEPEQEPEPEPEVEQPKPTLQAPEIVFSKKYGEPSILGTSDYGNTEVLITFMASDGTKVFILGHSDANGGFNIAVPNSLKRGLYSVSAVMVKEDKTNSETSNTIIIKIGSIFSDLTWEIWLLLLLLLLAILYLIMRIIMHLRKEKNLNKDIKKELHEAENIVNKSFDILREDVIDYDSEKISAAEHKHMLSLKKDLNEAEKIIDKKIKDIEP